MNGTGDAAKLYVKGWYIGLRDAFLGVGIECLTIAALCHFVLHRK